MNEHCAAHVINSERISALETYSKVYEQNIANLYEKLDRQAKCLGEIKTSLESMNVSVNGAFMRIETTLRNVRDDSEERKKHVDEILKANAELIKQHEEKFDKSKWFLDPLNKWKNSLPMFVFRIMIGVLVLLSFLHWADVGGKIEKWMTK